MKFELPHIEQFIRNLGSDSLEVVGGDYEGGIHLQQVPDEIAPLLHDLLDLQSGRQFENYLEIGAAAGGTAYLFDYFFGFRNIILIDDNKHKKWTLRHNILKDVKYQEFIGDSHSSEAHQFADTAGDGPYDMILIDGDHSYEGVKKDAETYLGMLNLKGFVMFHDTQASPGVKKFFREMKVNKYFKLVKEYVSETHHRPCGIGLLQRIG